MVHIDISPAYGGRCGCYHAMGHAKKGHEAVCTAITALSECLAANLANTWNIKMERVVASGVCTLRWHKTDKYGKGLNRANTAAGFAYTGLKALSQAWPEDVEVKWTQPWNDKEGKKK